MRVYAQKEFKWNGNTVEIRHGNFMLQLYSVTPAKDQQGLWRVVYPDGEPSADFYNKTRAKEHSMILSMRYMNGDSQETAPRGLLVSLNAVPATTLAKGDKNAS